MTETVHLGTGGRLVIPASFRRALGLEAGDEVVMVLEEGGLKLLTRSQAIRTARELVRRYVASDRSLVDELAAERRAEAADE
jgi:AbrB family looped-hinge helix DNA binding protein